MAFFRDTEFKDARVSARLSLLTPASQVSFAAGSLDHAYAQLRKRAPWKDAQGAARRIEGALASAWAFIETGRHVDDPRAAVQAMLKDVHLSEDEPGEPGEDNLFTAATKLTKLLGRDAFRSKRGAIERALDVADNAYQAIVEVALPDVGGGEETMEAAERDSELCRQELAFQIGYLGALERLGRRGNQAPTLAAVRAAMAGASA